MTHRIFTLTAALLAACLATSRATAAPSPPMPSPVAPSPVPTTHILAIGTLVPGVDPQRAQAILPEEVRATVKLHLDGKIDQWFSLTRQRGVVFVLNVTDEAEAHAMLEALPLGQARLMTFQLLPIGPLNPLRQLIGPPASR